MSDTLDLFTDRMTAPYRGEPPHNGVETSIEAAESVRETVKAMRLRVLALIKARGDYGAICNEIENITGIKHQTCSARFRELELSGHITKTDRKRKTDSKRNAVVYVAREGA